ncbi:EAL domain-containing protein [Cronobacter dublinensis]|nr:EAL domain-containing protein [Cronobacter dublinensis]
MNFRARRQALRISGIIMVVLLPVMLALWLAHHRAVNETREHLDTFAQLVLNRTELVLSHVEKARNEAEKYQGEICSPAHQRNMLDISRGQIYVEDLIYAQGDELLCSPLFDQPFILSPANYTRTPDIAFYYYRDTPFFSGHKMIYLRKGNYVAVVNPLSFSEILSNDATLSYGVYDTVTRDFFSLSEKVEARTLAPFVHSPQTVFQKEGRFWSIVVSGKRPIAIIVSTSDDWFWQAWQRQMSVMLPLGLLMGGFLMFIGTRTRNRFNSPSRQLQRALHKRALRLHYQPIMDIKHGMCVGAEALLRWPGYNGQVMSPAEFIPLAEKTGMIAQVTDYVVEELFNDLGHFLATHPQIYISINLSASDFHSSRLIALIEGKNSQHGVRAQQIKIEVTERGFIDVPRTTPVIQAFRQSGFEIAIDDFGTGYSNLHNLYSLNVDILKIDKSFIDTLTTNSTSHLIAEHIIDMAQSLRLKIIAEGVETAEQVTWLLKRGVQYCQGWHFSKALSQQEFITWLQQDDARAMPGWHNCVVNRQAL